MRQVQNKKFFDISLALFMAVSSLTVLAYTQHAHASATMSETFVRFDHMEKSLFSSGTVCAMPTSTATEAKVKVTFPTGFVVSTTLGDWTVDNTTNTGSWPKDPSNNAATAWPGINTATAASGQDVTFPSSDLTAGTLYCFNWLNSTTALQQPSGAAASEIGSVTTQTSAPADIDVGQYATATINDDTISVSATVPVAFNFALANTTDALGNLSTGAVSSSGTPATATVNTNAKNGWLVWAKDASTGLHSAAASYTIPANTYGGSPTTVTAGSEGYNMGVTQTQAGGSGTLTVDPGFVGTVSHQGGGLTTSFHKIATSTGSADNAVLTLTNNAAIKASTPAATDYTDVITVVGAGLF